MVHNGKKLNQGHAFSPYLFKIHFNIILPSRPEYKGSFLYAGVSTNIMYAFLISPYVLYSPHFIRSLPL
jgi:hypothetical protein